MESAPFWWRAVPDGEEPEVRLDPPQAPLLWEQGRLESGGLYWWRAASSGGKLDVRLDEPTRIETKAGARAQLEDAPQLRSISSKQEQNRTASSL